MSVRSGLTLRIIPIDTCVSAILVALLSACDGGQQTTPEAPPSPDATQNAPDGPLASQGALSVQVEVWADNWFAFYLGEHVIIEDSTPITTERSFNAETLVFEAEYPLQMNFVASDFRENDMGLEDIGRRNQQMGDGGLIAQFTDTAQETISRPQTPPADA